MAVRSGKDVRLRRTQSVTKMEEVAEREKKQRENQPDQPCHSPQDSLLSSSSGYTNYRGLLNLCIILLVLSNTRVALENIIKYGILVDPVSWITVFMEKPTSSPSVLILLGLNIYIIVSYLIELIRLKGFISEKFCIILATVNLIAVVVGPPAVVYNLDCHPVSASAVLGFNSIVFMKLVSYHMVNYWCRQQKHQATNRIRRRGSFKRERPLDLPNGDSKNCHQISYPDNLTFKDMYYFMFAPTLCYELNFPRSARIRKRFLIKRILEMLFLVQLILGLVQQWIIPTINNSRKPLQEMNYSRMLERLLKLSVPNHLIWLIFFYWYFHSCLNAVAEILRFADRQFYRDWWNAETVHYFWQNWNIPVHRWCVRHLYKPLVRRGFTKDQAKMAVFMVSAFFHEYLVSVPLRMFRIWAFTGMVGQVPFAMFVSRFLHNQYGNIAVWISLIIGQPLCILMYYHDYYIIHYGTLETTS